MRVIIAGGRHYKLSDEDREWLDELFALHGFKQVISGGATGADHGGEVWARSRGVELKIIKAQWAAHGRAAGPIRNREMAEQADAVVLFPGGSGTKSMRSIAKELGLQVFEWVERFQ